MGIGKVRRDGGDPVQSWRRILGRGRLHMRGAFDLDPDPVFDAALECRETTECERAGDGHGFQTDRSLQTAGLGDMRPDLRIGYPGAGSLVENGRNDMHAVRTGGHAAVHPRFGVALGVLIGHIAKGGISSWLAQQQYRLPSRPGS